MPEIPRADCANCKHGIIIKLCNGDKKLERVYQKLRQVYSHDFDLVLCTCDDSASAFQGYTCITCTGTGRYCSEFTQKNRINTPAKAPARTYDYLMNLLSVLTGIKAGKPMTNRDRLRMMTAEEIIKTLRSEIQPHHDIKVTASKEDGVNVQVSCQFVDQLLEWLNKEVVKGDET